MRSLCSLLFVLALFSGCGKAGYRTRLARPVPSMQESDCFIVFMVNARGLDYSGASPLMKTIAKHPSDSSKNTDVGHAWIYLRLGDFELEGGHSAETGVVQPRYFEGVSLLAEKGDPNPARYLFCPQRDGHFEIGPGGHIPTFAAKIDLTSEEAEKILAYISVYPFENYKLNGCNCASFVSEVAALVGLHLDCRVSLTLDPFVTFRGETIQMWRDSQYHYIEIASPDVLQQSLIEAVESGQAQYALKWARQHRKECFVCRTTRTLKELKDMSKRALFAF